MQHYNYNRDQNLIFSCVSVRSRHTRRSRISFTIQRRMQTIAERKEQRKRNEEGGRKTKQDQEEEERGRRKRERKKKRQKREKDKKNTTKKNTIMLPILHVEDADPRRNFNLILIATDAQQNSDETCDDMIRPNHTGSFEGIFLLRVPYAYALSFVVLPTRSSRIPSLRDCQEASTTYPGNVVNIWKEKIPSSFWNGSIFEFYFLSRNRRLSNDTH